eukprot:5227447-Amphidinium_carterae.1
MVTYSDEGDEDCFILSLGSLLVLDVMGAGCGPTLNVGRDSRRIHQIVQVVKLDVVFCKKRDVQCSGGSAAFVDQPC